MAAIVVSAVDVSVCLTQLMYVCLLYPCQCVCCVRVGVFDVFDIMSCTTHQLLVVETRGRQQNTGITQRLDHRLRTNRQHASQNRLIWSIPATLVMTGDKQTARIIKQTHMEHTSDNRNIVGQLLLLSCIVRHCAVDCPLRTYSSEML